MSRSWKNLAMLCVLCLFLGCSSKPTPIPIPEETKGGGLTRIVTAYEAAAKKLGRPPNSAAELAPFLEKDGNPEALMLSPNDGQPYIILWGVDLTKKKDKKEYLTSPVLAHERSGKNGVRQVVDIFGEVKSLDATAFADITFAPGSTVK